MLALNFCGCANPFFGFVAEELEELFWLGQNYTYILAASKNIAIFWLESDRKTLGGVVGLQIRDERRYDVVHCIVVVPQDRIKQAVAAVANAQG